MRSNVPGVVHFRHSGKDFLNKTIIHILLRLYNRIPDDESIY